MQFRRCVDGWNQSAPLPLLGLPTSWPFRRDIVESALAKLETEGQVMRGRFSPELPPDESSGAIDGFWRAFIG